jgi:hypothetical protein
MFQRCLSRVVVMFHAGSGVERCVSIRHACSMFYSVGGSIPFMGMLGEKFPNTQFVITGVLG